MNDLKSQLRSLVVEALRLNQPPESIPDTHLTATLGLDSINSLELLILVEDHFKIRIDDEDLSVALVDSLEVLASYITEKLVISTKRAGQIEVGKDHMTAVGTATHWDELTEGYDPVMSSDPAYRSMLMVIVNRMGSPRRILDLGCGTGALTQVCHRLFPDAEIIGLDPASKMLDQARSRLVDRKITFVEGNAADLTAFLSASFDAVVSNFALHHLSHDQKRTCTREVMRVLHPGGIFINGDQHCALMGDVDDPERILHTLELLTNKARYYFLNAGIKRMLLQLQLLPRFICQDGEILATPEFWVEVLGGAGFTRVEVDVIEPAALMNRVISGVRPTEQRIG